MMPEEYYITLLTTAGRISEDRVTGAFRYHTDCGDLFIYRRGTRDRV